MQERAAGERGVHEGAGLFLRTQQGRATALEPGAREGASSGPQHQRPLPVPALQAHARQRRVPLRPALHVCSQRRGTPVLAPGTSRGARRGELGAAACHRGRPEQCGVPLRHLQPQLHQSEAAGRPHQRDQAQAAGSVPGAARLPQPHAGPEHGAAEEHASETAALLPDQRLQTVPAYPGRAEVYLWRLLHLCSLSVRARGVEQTITPR